MSLAKVFGILPTLKIDSISTVELDDESQPDGWVVFKDAQGVVRMAMPREDYEAFREFTVLRRTLLV